MLDIAVKAIKAGAKISFKHYKNTPKISYKSDGSPVTIADKTAELQIRRIIGRYFPDHGIIGEEHEPTNPNSRFLWVIDPIDGTKQFTRKIPVWGSFLGLLKDGKPYLGVIYYPCFNELYTAQKGKGAYLNGKRIHVSKTNTLEKAYLAHGTIKRFSKHGVLNGLEKIDEKAYSVINLGPYSIGQLAQGNIDINLDGGGNLWDFVAPAIVIEEAGGKFSDFSGNQSFASNNIVLTNGLLHPKVISLLNS